MWSPCSAVAAGSAEAYRKLHEPGRSWQNLQRAYEHSIIPRRCRSERQRESRRPGMSKRKKHHGTGKHPQLPSGPGLEVWRTRIESLLASGKSRDAVEAAKQCLKHTPGPDAEALAVKAYAARIEALQASGMHREAQALGTLVRERFPAQQVQVALLMRHSEVSTGNFESLLIELTTAEAQRRHELEAILSR